MALQEYRTGIITAGTGLAPSGAFDVYTSGTIQGRILKIFFLANSGGAIGNAVAGSYEVRTSGLANESQSIIYFKGTSDVDKAFRPGEYFVDNTNVVTGSPNSQLLPFISNGPLRFIGSNVGPGSAVSGLIIWYKNF